MARPAQNKRYRAATPAICPPLQTLEMVIMEKIVVAIHSFGNIGRYALDAVLASPDCRCAGVIRRPESVGKDSYSLRVIPDFPSLDA